MKEKGKRLWLISAPVIILLSAILLFAQIRKSHDLEAMGIAELQGIEPYTLPHFKTWFEGTNVYRFHVTISEEKLKSQLVENGFTDWSRGSIDVFYPGFSAYGTESEPLLAATKVANQWRYRVCYFPNEQKLAFVSWYNY